MSTQNSNNTPYIIIILILLAVILGGGTYFLFFQNRGNSSETTSEEKRIDPPAVADITDDEEATKYKKDTLLGELECVKDQKPDADYCLIEDGKILNPYKGFQYTLTELTKEDSLQSDFEKLAKIEIDKDDPKIARINFDKDMVKRYYDMDGLNFTITVPFSRKALSSKICGFGQGVGDEYIFFLMEDGTIDMLRVYSMLTDKKYDPYVIKGVKDVTAILGGSSYSEYSGGHTNYAVRSDKTAYDLMSLLPSWGGGQ